MKTIDIIRKGTPEQPGYNDSVCVIENGNVLFEGPCSTEPNPYNSTSKKPWPEVYARVAEGEYIWQLLAAHKRFGRCLLINGGGEIPTLNPNPNQHGKYFAKEIFIHKGYSEKWRGSKACLTVPPITVAPKFFGVIHDYECGKLTIRKAAA